ncbi:Flavocytochrome c [Rhizoclosmatium globosum]|uniref:fumarate reductase (NADH) n=1 Tax=Rhizoclosmatium globosum TaxID=329046 RepID=A0A1Y2BNY2_9FUNG|nr:Flavocytochrome c [Rhizoclosmatium globosum]|eukprot:ORY36462.1 Flavocytochrome c [Rhizoclosmatium globosum]
MAGRRSQVIVLGGGLAGLSACHTVLERGGNVLLLDKNNFLGGNSTKATSGINGAGTTAQQRLGIPDSSAIFYEDSAKSARAEIQPALTKVLTYQSGSAVEWISEQFKVDLSLVSRLGGHSHPRTHRGKEMFPGMTMTYALMEKYEDLCKSHPDRAKLIKKAKATSLIKNENGAVIGVEYEHNGATHKAYGPVVIATGGYAADFTSDSLLKKYRPEIYDLPTTNGDHCTGDGIKFALKSGANTIHMDKVQVHPTGLVDLKDPDAKVKFLAAEALRGVGGILVDANGQRFCDELGHRDYVTGQMWKNKGPFRLILNSKAGKEIEWHCKHYMGRGLMKHFKTGAEVAKEIGISASALDDTFKKYNQIAQSKNDPFGKKFFSNAPFDINDNYWVSIVCPVLHFTMGGVQIDEHSRLLGGGANATPIPGAFACGEVAGGVHGANRLGGSSLLGCVVYGRVAGASAATYLMESLTANAARRVAGVAGHLSPVSISFNGLKVTVESAGASAETSQAVVAAAAPAASAAAQAPAAAAAPAAKKTLREITTAEVAKHNKENDCWVIVNGQVLDATPFLNDHPGGKKAILIYAGKDATEEFNMMHKRDVVDKYAPEIIIGVHKA